MYNLNSVILAGNIGSEIRLSKTRTGMPVANFCLATKDFWNNSRGEREEKTVWHNITAWGKLAEIVASQVQKGTSVLVQGRLDWSSFEKDGVHITKTFVVAELIQFDQSVTKQAREKNLKKSYCNETGYVRDVPRKAERTSYSHSRETSSYEPAYNDFDEEIPF